MLCCGWLECGIFIARHDWKSEFKSSHSYLIAVVKYSHWDERTFFFVSHIRQSSRKNVVLYSICIELSQIWQRVDFHLVDSVKCQNLVKFTAWRGLRISLARDREIFILNKWKWKIIHISLGAKIEKWISRFHRIANESFSENSPKKCARLENSWNSIRIMSETGGERRCVRETQHNKLIKIAIQSEKNRISVAPIAKRYPVTGN